VLVPWWALWLRRLLGSELPSGWHGWRPHSAFRL